MAKTSGHGNGIWTRDETILALDLLLSLDCQVPSAKCQVPSAKCQVPSAKCQVPSDADKRVNAPNCASPPPSDSLAK
jgi:hypothetical protein